MSIQKLVGLSLFLFLVAGCGGATQQDRSAERPNIIFIMADDLGYGHLGSYGQEKIATPHIDQLAAEGMRFTQSYAGATVCAPSRSVLMTGLHGGRSPVRGNLGGQPLHDEDITLAEILKQAGYQTGGFGKWGLGVEGTSGHPLDQGFDEFVGYLHQVHAHFYYPYWLTDGHGTLLLPENEGRKQARYAHDVIAERALEFIRKNKDQPFFCYLPVTIPHVELAVPESSLEQYQGRWPETPGAEEKRPGYIVSQTPKATYAAMVSHLDRDVGRIAALVKELGIDQRTLIIFTSDNGGQSGVDVQEEFFQANGELRGYKGSMYEGGLRVPMIARWPGRIRPGAVSDHITHFADMMPTF
ncbi:MAG: arylsulfatase, partial [Acidobacteria bacterium]|nr:arylsulfatase [Acidobacteriota bacterium]